MSYKIKKSREIIWCEADDRYILLEKEDGNITGLNYMQGEEGVDYFEDNFGESDGDLVDYYNAVCRYLGSDSELDRLNSAIWAYAVYCNSRAYRESEKTKVKICNCR
jgi:intergrase/recombinase